jgi:hypothetical protein
MPRASQRIRDVLSMMQLITADPERTARILRSREFADVERWIRAQYFD